VEQNREGRHIWPGGYSDRVGTGTRDWPASEVLAQIGVTREQAGATGNVHFRMSSLMQSPDSLAERLARISYAEPALVPPSPWLHTAAPGPPRIALQDRAPARTILRLAPEGAEEVFLWTVRAREGADWTILVVPGWRREVSVSGAPEQIVVSAVGRTGNEGLGFDKVVWSYPGALFLSAGGYHHHLGLNTWAAGAAPAGEADARLLEWEILVPSAEDVGGALESLAAAGHVVEPVPDGGVVRDAWGTALRVRSPSGDGV
jgi:hypothetical protein